MEYGISVDTHTGAGGLSIPVRLSRGRGALAPSLQLAYSSGAGNSGVGAGWSLGGLPFIGLDTREGAPRHDGTDPFAYGGHVALVPELEADGTTPRVEDAAGHRVHIYRNRYGHSPLRYERWVHRGTRDVHWRTRDRNDVVTVFGRTPLYRLADPDDPSRIFRWLVEARYDPTGNAESYTYLAEDGAGLDPALPYEAPRIRRGTFAERYPKRILYGNSAPLHPDEPAPADLAWHFEVVFDYGDHGDDARPDPDRAWTVRADPFSSGRAGFEVRTYRLLRRILMFHRFEPLGSDAALVGATRLTHHEDPAGSTLVGVDYEGRRRDGGAVSSGTLPALALAYSSPEVGPGFTPLQPETLENVPAGLTGASRLVDLYGEGLPGILTETAGAWFYKRNLGGGRFGPQECVSDAPSLRDGPLSLGDFDRDGNPNLGRLLGRDAGYYEYDRQERRWRSFTPFASVPHVAAEAPVQWVDLNADGLPDLIVPHPEHLTWYPSLGSEGFGEPVDIPLPRLRGSAPPLLAEDVALRFFFADMTGDGLLDLVHVDSGGIEYWPHLGHGRFGEGVVMEGAPVFDHAGTFDPRRIRLADIDGSGTSDLLYLGRGEVRFWTNASGNRFVDGGRRDVPYIDDLASVQVLDILADGTPSLVWSSALAADASASVRHLPLTGGVEPRLLLSVSNGMGRENRLTYGSSAAHYLRSRETGREWATRLPTHVTVVDRLEELDHIGGGRLVSRYEYHDGQFDSRERTFRGFGLVDQYDAEVHPGGGAAPEHYTAPSCIRTWFHDGVLGREPLRVRDAYAADPLQIVLPPAAMENPGELGPEEFEDAQRALAGLVLRQEVYATGAAGQRAPHPFQVSQSSYRVRRLQPSRGRDPSAFAAYRSERLDYDYGEQPDDPRAAHHLTLDVDEYGIVRSEVHVSYPRRTAGPAGTEAQRQLVAGATRTTVAHHDVLDRYLVGVAVETGEFELLGLTPGASGLVNRGDLLAGVPPALDAPLEVHEPDDGSGGVRARRREWERYFYWNDQRTGALPLGEPGAPLLLHHEEAACFTDPLLGEAYGSRVDPAMLASAGYTRSDGYWWQPGPVYHHRGRGDFYTLSEETAPAGGTTRFTFDPFLLTHSEVRDGLGNTTRVETDYQALAPARVTDSNGAITESRYDPLGVAVVTVTRGTVRDVGGTERPYGGAPLDEHVPPPGATLQDILADPAAFVQRADGCLFYDAHAWTRDRTPPHALALVREALVHDGEGGGTAEGPVEVVLSYYDGFARALQQKQRVEPGPAVQRGAGGGVVLDAGGAPVLADAAERWLVSGHTVYTNKQQPVRQYEPFFSATSAFEADEELREYGVAAEHHYDALGELVRTDFPNGTFTRAERTPWLERRYDANDTVAGSAYRLAREGLPSEAPERGALEGALRHADTPAEVHFDALGREILLVETGEGGVEHTTRQAYDGAGRLAEVVDARGLSAFGYRYDMLGRMLHERSMDAGERWIFADVQNSPVHEWDARGVHLTTSYDALGRPTAIHADGLPGLDQVVERWSYGEGLPDAEARARNARGRVVEHHDGAGVLTLHEYAPAGAPLRYVRRLRTDYRGEPDWTDPAAVALEPEAFETRTRYDALGRVVAQHTPDGATRRLDYLPGGALSQVRLTTAAGELSDVPILESARYNARGQRTRAVLGNGVELDVDYDADTFRMRRLRARRFEASGTRLYQDLAYTYDPVGNVVHLADAAQQPANPDPHVLQGLNVASDCRFTYDAFYRLTEATGRVHQALLQHDYRRDLPDPDAVKGTRHLSLNNGAAVERYTRTYRYDREGNLVEMKHAGASREWTARKWVSAASNRALPADDIAGNPIADPEGHFDAAGHCIRLPHLRALDWDCRGRLQRAVIIDRSSTGGPDDAEYYTYDGAGQRRRKVTEKLSEGTLEVTEKLYLDGCEIKRIRRGGNPILERHTAHVGDGVNRVALVHRWVRDDRARETDTPGGVRVHYQLQNHLGSTALELDEDGDVITYEEFFPYGGSAFIAGDAVRDVRIKDYRYSGKERDDETGFYYYGYRYYAPFIGNWVSPDPLGPADGLNLYRFVRNNPVTLTDPNGLQSTAGGADVEPGRLRHFDTETLPPQFQSAFDNLSPQERIEWQNQNLFFTLDEQGAVMKMNREQAEAYVRERAQEGLDTNVGWVGGTEEEELDVTITTYEENGQTVQHFEFHEGITFGGDEEDLTLLPDPSGTPANGSNGPPPDPADPAARTNPDAGDRPQQGRGLRGNGPGGGGEDPEGTGTGQQGRGTGSGTRGNGRSSGGTNGGGQTPGAKGGTGSKVGQRTGGRRGSQNGTGVTPPPEGAAHTPGAPQGYDPNGSPTGIPEPPPNGYRPPPPGTLPGGTDPDGSPTGSLNGSRDGTGDDPSGAGGQGGNGQGGEQGGGTPPQRERDTLDTLVDIASYVTLDAFFSDDEGGGDPNGVPGGMGLFDLNLGRAGQVAYVALAAVDLVLTVLTLGKSQVVKQGLRATLRQGMRQLRRLAPLAKQAIKEAGERTIGAIRSAGARVVQALRSRFGRPSSYDEFFSVQGPEDVARLLERGGLPWPTGMSHGSLRDIFGPGLYTFATREQAQSYAELLARRGASDLNVLMHRIPADDLARLRTADLTSMTDEAANAILELGEHHGFEQIIRRTGNFGVEHFFRHDVYHLFTNQVLK